MPALARARTRTTILVQSARKHRAKKYDTRDVLQSKLAHPRFVARTLRRILERNLS